MLSSPRRTLDPSPVSLRLGHGGLTQSSVWRSWRKIEMNHQFWSLSQNGSWSYLSFNLPGAQTSSWTLGSQNLVILIGFVIIKCSGLLLLTNPNPRGRYQSKDGLDCAGARGGLPRSNPGAWRRTCLVPPGQNGSRSEQERNSEKGSESKD